MAQATKERASRQGLGADLRALRRSRGLTLTELGARIGRSVGFLSQIERDLSDVAIADLRRIAAALDVPLGLFFVQDGAPEDERGHVVRADGRRRIGSSESGLVEELLSPDLGGAFEVFHSTFAPGAELATPHDRATEEAGYVVSGEFEIWIGDKQFHLKAGDSFRFRHARHRWRNPGPTPATVIWVIAPPVY
jgi:transcriptional regulator with XRE-family HTH domain